MLTDYSYISHFYIVKSAIKLLKCTYIGLYMQLCMHFYTYAYAYMYTYLHTHTYVCITAYSFQCISRVHRSTNRRSTNRNLAILTHNITCVFQCACLARINYMHTSTHMYTIQKSTTHQHTHTHTHTTHTHFLIMIHTVYILLPFVHVCLCACVYVCVRVCAG